MQHNNKGSILVTTLIIFSIILTMAMTCIGLHYTNSNIFNLEYKETDMTEIGYGAIEIVNSNILESVQYILKNTSNKEEFNNYFLGNNFLIDIKDITKSELKGVSINVPSNIKIDKTNGTLEFKVISNVVDNKYSKKFQASVKINNPFLNSVKDFDENLQKDKDDNIETDIKEYNIKEIVKVYDYKEI